MTIVSTGFLKIVRELLIDDPNARRLIALVLKRSCCSILKPEDQHPTTTRTRQLTPGSDLALRHLDEGALNDLSLVSSIKSIEEMGRDIMKLISSFADFKKQQSFSFVDDMKINFILFSGTRLSFD